MNVLESTNREKVALVICSMDANSDLWPLLDIWYSKFPLKYDIYIIANYQTEIFENLTVLSVGEDTSWSESLGKGLDKLDHDYVLVTFDDLLPTQFNPSDPSVELGLFYQSEDLDAIRFAPSSVRHEQLGDGDSYGNVIPGQRYYFSLVFSMWRRGRLLELLKRVGPCGPWAFENNSERQLQSRFKIVSASSHRHIRYLNGLIKGAWDPAVLQNPDVKKYVVATERSVLSGHALLTLRLKQIWYRALHALRRP